MLWIRESFQRIRRSFQRIRVWSHEEFITLPTFCHAFPLMFFVLSGCVSSEEDHSFSNCNVATNVRTGDSLIYRPGRYNWPIFEFCRYIGIDFIGLRGCLQNAVILSTHPDNLRNPQGSTTNQVKTITLQSRTSGLHMVEQLLWLQIYCSVVENTTWVKIYAITNMVFCTGIAEGTSLNQCEDGASSPRPGQEEGARAWAQGSSPAGPGHASQLERFVCQFCYWAALARNFI